MAVGRLFVLVERHHVDRAHLLDLLAQHAALVFLRDERFAFDVHDLFVFAQHYGFDIDFSQAACFEMFEV